MSTSAVDLGALYSAARHRIVDLIASSPPRSLDQICAATPDWTVHDVIAHLRGICEDVRTGNMDGVTTDPWTAAQVARHRDTPMADLLTGWAEDAPLIEGFLSSPDGASAYRAVFDIATHEADLRGELQRTSCLENELGSYLMRQLVPNQIANAADLSLASLRVETDEGDFFGAMDASTVLRASRFELFRALSGRRSRAQAMAFNWSCEDPSAYVDSMFIFGPRRTDLVETFAVE